MLTDQRTPGKTLLTESSNWLNYFKIFNLIYTGWKFK